MGWDPPALLDKLQRSWEHKCITECTHMYLCAQGRTFTTSTFKQNKSITNAHTVNLLQSCNFELRNDVTYRRVLFCFVPCFLGRDKTLGTPHIYVNCSCSCIYLYQSLRGKISLKIFSSADPSEAQWPLSPQGLSAFMPVMSLISQPLMHQSSTTAPLTQARVGVLGDKIHAWEVHNVGEHLVHVQSMCHIL